MPATSSMIFDAELANRCDSAGTPGTRSSDFRVGGARPPHGPVELRASTCDHSHTDGDRGVCRAFPSTTEAAKPPLPTRPGVPRRRHSRHLQRGGNSTVGVRRDAAPVLLPVRRQGPSRTPIAHRRPGPIIIEYAWPIQIGQGSVHRPYASLSRTTASDTRQASSTPRSD